MSVATIENLHVSFPTATGWTEVVKGIDLHIDAGETVALVGESGSGKSVTARTLAGLSGRGARITADRLEIFGSDARTHGEREWKKIRGSHVGFVLQDALVSLDPLRSIGTSLREALSAQARSPRKALVARSIELLETVGMPEPERRLRQYPHELSGGLRQRALIAAAIAGDPGLVVADEPTTALDVTVQKQILGLFAQRASAGLSTLIISHDLAVVSELADRVLVMHHGVVVESGDTAEVLDNPQHPYTQKLLSAVPSANTRGRRLAPETRTGPITLPTKTIHDQSAVLSVRGISKTYGVAQTARTVVHDVDLDLFGGETLGIVGESGSGKSTVARIVLGLTAPDTGEVVVEGQQWTGRSEKELRRYRRRVQLIAQDPTSSFDPRYDVERVIGESLDTVDVHGSERRARVRAIVDAVHLPQSVLRRNPRDLSGGQRQRIAIARALVPEPALIVADEPVSALDVSIQAQVLDLLAELQAEFGTSLLFISHDLGVVHHLADRVAVMQNGRVVESGTVTDVFASPQHVYTTTLLDSVPVLRRKAVRP